MNKFAIIFCILFYPYFSSYAGSSPTSSFTEKFFRVSKYSFNCTRIILNEYILPTQNCWNKDNYPLYDGKNPKIRFVANAPTECIFPGYPLIAIEDNNATHWIQIVSINITLPENKYSLQDAYWIFFDTSDDFIKKNIPFYNTVTP